MINRFLAEMKKLVNIILPILFIASMPLQIYGQKHPKLQNLPRYDNKKIHFGFECDNVSRIALNSVILLPSNDSTKWYKNLRSPKNIYWYINASLLT